jgi:UDP-N-acetylglucosamine 2-epimerase
VIESLPLVVQKVGKTSTNIPAIDLAGLRSRQDFHSLFITTYSRESFREGFESICRAIVELARRFPRAQFVYPVYLTQKMRESLKQSTSKNLPNDK